MTVRCWVYKGSRQPDMYLYLRAVDDFAAVPKELLDRLGALELAVSFELHPERKLARANADAVLSALHERGYYLQLPPPKT